MIERKTNIDVIAWLEDEEKNSFGTRSEDDRNVFHDILLHFNHLELESQALEDENSELLDELLVYENIIDNPEDIEND
jgi:hypothetical protein